ncbi:type II secretion system protein [Chamaesiphon sp. VAR_48_metabat_135_sub]|uniref:type IV pilus modification PilV family protein n=1 Tax=Chamaesiphon sp. VAR_48_metabat_135_sub TaxID=2964699 RepID=UPI00286BB1EC|nr:type II secretion system protein [Chamaesiphon sp. VAR_48_metabat_135_sub]
MKTNLNKNFANQKAVESSQGFSLIETVIALTTLGICLAYAMPLFLYAKINNSKSEIRTGALIVSQRVFDNIRSKSITGLPSNDGQNAPSAINPVSTPANMTTPTNEEMLLTKAMGRQYQTTVTYCQGLDTTPAQVGPPAIPAIPADPTVCSNKYRKFKVEVSYNGSKVYDLEGTFTEFE